VAPTINKLKFLVHLNAHQVTEPQGNLPRVCQDINKATAKAKALPAHHEDFQVVDVSGKHLTSINTGLLPLLCPSTITAKTKAAIARCSG